MNHDTEQVGETRSVPAGKYAREIDLESDSTHARVARLVGTDREVLELGPGPGHMTAVLSERGCTVTGIEVDAHAAEMAAHYCQRMIVGDLDELDLESELADARFEVIVAADVLEHLKDPLRALKRLRAFLAPAGFFVISLPNVAHGSVRLALLEGHFRYQDIGLLDRTHLRFFTRESIDELLDEAELGAAEIFRQPLNMDASEVPFDADSVPDGVLETLKRDPEARTYQFVIKAIPIEIEGMREMQRRMRELAHESALMRDRHVELETGNAALETQNAQLLDVSRNTHDMRAALIEAHDQVLRRDEEIHRLQEEMNRLRAELDGLRAERDALGRERDALGRERNALGRERDAQREQALRLRVRLDRITSSPPMRAYQLVGQLPGVRGLKASRTEGYQRALRGTKDAQ
jgi:2-polyprenyl-3-methyl-5-hydroxy-6-metoxy-1,4-benzoquinol methylase